jgi:hypothetical protein
LKQLWLLLAHFSQLVFQTRKLIWHCSSPLQIKIVLKMLHFQILSTGILIPYYKANGDHENINLGWDVFWEKHLTADYDGFSRTSTLIKWVNDSDTKLSPSQIIVENLKENDCRISETWCYSIWKSILLPNRMSQIVLNNEHAIFILQWELLEKDKNVIFQDNVSFQKHLSMHWIDKDN